MDKATATLSSKNPEEIADSEAKLLDFNRNRKVLDYVNGLLKDAKSHRMEFERQWYMNLAFYFGRQWVQWVPGTAGSITRLYEPAVPPWRVRIVSNKIRPIIRTEIAKLIKEKPQAFVIPASNEDEDLLAAKAGEQLFEHHWREIKLDRQIRRTAFWLTTCGTAFLKSWYDPKKVDADGNRGMVTVEPISPFHIYVPDVQEEELDNQPFVIHSLAKSNEWMKARYPDQYKKLAAHSEAKTSSFQSQFFSAIGIKNQPSKLMTVNEAWIKPNVRFKTGAVVIWSGDVLLSLIEGWPYEHKEYPFSKVDHIPTGKFYADSAIPDLIPLQKEYNRTKSQMIEAKNRMAKPQLMAPRGAVNPNKITSEPGLIVEYTPGFNPPTPIPLQDLPSYVPAELDRLQRDMDDISAQHEITKGRTPPGVTAATAISYLQEEDDSKLSISISSLEEAVERIGRQTLSYVQQYWQTPRLIKVLGEDNQYEATKFSGADLKGNTDLRIESGSAMPRSRAAKQAFIMELGKMQWIPPDRALRYLDMAETSRLHEELQIDARQAQRENNRITDGNTEVLVNDWDNHEVHILEHNNFRKKQKFENLPPEVQAAFDQHVKMHKQIVAKMMMAKASVGGPPMPGGDNPGGAGGGPTESSGPAPPKPSVPPAPVGEQ